MDNASVVSATSALGVDSVVVEVPAHVVFDFQKLYDWKFRGIPEKSRPMTLQGFIESQISDDGRTHAKYAEDSAYRMVEKLVFDHAKLNKIAPHESAAKLGVQLRDAK